MGAYNPPPDLERMIGALAARVAVLERGGPLVPYVQAARVASQVSANGAVDKLSFDTEVYDVGGMFAPGTPTRITFPIAGRYLVTSYVLASSSAAGVRYTDIINNLGATLVADRRPVSPDGSHQASISTVQRFAGGDFVEFEIYQTSGGNQNWTAVVNAMRLGNT